MSDRRLLSLAVGIFALSLVPFWLWKLYLITQRHMVLVLTWLFVILYGLALVLSFLVGSRRILRGTPSVGIRVFDFALLLFFEVNAAIMAAFAMNFIGQ